MVGCLHPSIRLSHPPIQPLICPLNIYPSTYSPSTINPPPPIHPSPYPPIRVYPLTSYLPTELPKLPVTVCPLMAASTYLPSLPSTHPLFYPPVYKLIHLPPHQPNQISCSSIQPLNHAPIHLFIHLLINPPLYPSLTISPPATVHPSPTYLLSTCHLSLHPLTQAVCSYLPINLPPTHPPSPPPSIRPLTHCLPSRWPVLLMLNTHVGA